MEYSMVADIMFVAPGEHGPIWPDTDGIIQAMELAKANGLDAIEIFDFDSRDLARLADAKTRLGIGIATMSMKNGKLWAVPGKAEEFAQGLKDSIEAAGTLGVKKLVVSDDLYDKDVSREEIHAAMVENLKAAAPIAEAAGLTILAEPLSDHYFKDPGEAFEIIKEVGSDNVRLLYDIFHMQLIAGNITNTIKENLPLIGHIHGAGAPERCEITGGELNYRYILTELKKADYKEGFGLEFFTFTDREAKVKASADLLHSLEVEG
jgi:hydroxypyruvate isomerase